MVSTILAWPSQINKKANIHNIHEGCMLDKQYSLRIHPFLVSPRSPSLGTFRAEERRSSARNVPSGEERGETDVFAGYKLACEQALCLGKIARKGKGKGLFAFPSPHTARPKARSQASYKQYS